MSSTRLTGSSSKSSPVASWPHYVGVTLETFTGIIGVVLAGIAFGIFWLVSYMLGHVEGSGWTSLVILVLIFGGVQLLSIGIASEYIGRIYDEVKKRPRFIVESTQGLDES